MFQTEHKYQFNLIHVNYRELKSICRALYIQRDKIPEDRKKQLFIRLKELCPEETDFTDEFLKSNIDIETS